MKILIVAATEEEIRMLRRISPEEHQLRFLVTGPGMVATSYELSNHLRDNNYEVAINCGVAGSFDRSIKIGEVVNVTTDTFSEMGAQDGAEFIKYVDLNLGGATLFNNQITIDFSKLKNLNKSI